MTKSSASGLLDKVTSPANVPGPVRCIGTDCHPSYSTPYHPHISNDHVRTRFAQRRGNQGDRQPHFLPWPPFAHRDFYELLTNPGVFCQGCQSSITRVSKLETSRTSAMSYRPESTSEKREPAANRNAIPNPNGLLRGNFIGRRRNVSLLEMWITSFCQGPNFVILQRTGQKTELIHTSCKIPNRLQAVFRCCGAGPVTQLHNPRREFHPPFDGKMRDTLPIHIVPSVVATKSRCNSL